MKDSTQAIETPSKPRHKIKSSPPTSKFGESSYKEKRNKKSSEPCGFYGKRGHSKSKCWHKLEVLNEAMWKQKIPVSNPFSTSKGNALST